MNSLKKCVNTLLVAIILATFLYAYHAAIYIKLSNDLVHVVQHAHHIYTHVALYIIPIYHHIINCSYTLSYTLYSSSLQYITFYFVFLTLLSLSITRIKNKVLNPSKIISKFILSDFSSFKLKIEVIKSLENIP